MIQSDLIAPEEMSGGAAERPATPEDIRASFQLFHGRPADDEVVRDRVGQSIRSVVAGAVGSAEFEAEVMRPVAERRLPNPRLGLPDEGVTQDRPAAIISALQLDPDAAGAGGSLEVLRALNAAPLFHQTLEELYGRRRVDEFAAGLGHLGREADERRRRFEEAGSRLRARLQDLELQTWRDIAAEPGPMLRLTSEDAWFMVRVGAAASATSLTRLVLTARREDGAPLRPRVYLDLGEGVSPETALDLYAFGEPGQYMALVCDAAAVERLRIDPDDREGLVEIAKVALEPVTAEALEGLVAASATDPADAPYALRLARRMSPRVFSTGPRTAEDAFALTRELNQGCFRGASGYGSYPAWIARYATPDEADYRRMAEITAGFAVRPRFSFVVPTYNTPLDLLRKCVNSMLAQTYRDFEICIADDCSPKPEVAEYLEGLAAALPEVKFTRRRRNGHISEASNSALALATGDFVVLVDHDDEIPDYALFTVAAYVNARPDAAILFSDEDKIDVQGRRSDPYFKSEYNSFLMYGHNMVSHLGVYRRSLVEKVGGFRKGLEGSQDYDLFFRCYEQIHPEQVVHIPHVLYHWRLIPGSTSVSADQKDYAIIAAQAAINGHFERRGTPLRCIPGRAPGVTDITPSHFVDTTTSVIIPTRDAIEVLKPCIDSVRATIDPATVEIIVADNGSTDPETLAYLEALQRTGVAKVVPLPGPFNFSTINNEAAKQATGDVLCFLNNDTEVISPTWLERGRALLAIQDVGVVGARLLFPDGCLQHMGLALGMGDHGVAGTPHGGREERDPGYIGKAWLTAEFSAVTAACLFIRKQDFTAVGGFDPELPVAYNDIDLCLKMRRSGKKVICDGLMLLTHKESRTRGSDKSGPRAERLAMDMATIQARWASVLRSDPYYSPNLSLADGLLSVASPPRRPLPWIAAA